MCHDQVLAQRDWMDGLQKERNQMTTNTSAKGLHFTAFLKPEEKVGKEYEGTGMDP